MRQLEGFRSAEGRSKAKSIGVSTSAEAAETHHRETGVYARPQSGRAASGFSGNAPCVTFTKELGIRTESWSPLGQGHLLTNPVIGAVSPSTAARRRKLSFGWHSTMG